MQPDKKLKKDALETSRGLTKATRRMAPKHCFAFLWNCMELFSALGLKVHLPNSGARFSKAAVRNLTKAAKPARRIGVLGAVHFSA